MLLDVIILIVGLVILILGGDFLVRGASSIALRLNLTPLVVGLTIVAFGTSAPELLISVKSALSGSPDLAMGNVIGSNICNLALVLGITAIISPIIVQKSSISVDWPMTMGSSLLLYLMVREGYVDSHEGILFIFILGAYLFFVIWKSRKDTKTAKALEADFDLPDEAGSKLWKDILFIALGSVGLYLGAEWFVGGAQNLARQMGIEERVIGITVLALGTSLPELVTSSVASFKKQTDLALGNLMGSNIFNILSILGITSIIKEIKVSDVILNKDMMWMLGVTLIILPMMLSKRQLARTDGIILMIIYIYYTYTVVW
ncbi:calcium/sodium antiporter [Bacteroidota bacterium]